MNDHPQAVVMNVFYTGLGIARSLGERGIRVVALTSKRGLYGNFTRYAKTLLAPDSRSEPDALLEFLVKRGRDAGRRSVIFPTRDDDLVFLDRFRKDLEPYYSLVAPPSPALGICLNKWETYGAAVRAGVAAPRCWRVQDLPEVEALARQVTYPCVLKPLSPHQWRRGSNWELVGGRKAIAIQSEQELLLEYRMVARAEKRCVIQELVPGGDDCLFVQACYLDRASGYVAGFNAQKLVQVPEHFGTGCILQGADRPELLEPTIRLLQAIGFAGVAEVEYKWDVSAGEYKLIEINPRPWDQHRLGASCGVDLIYLAYCEHAGLPAPSPARGIPETKWVAEETLATTVLQLLWRRDPKLRSLLGHARGKRIYAIWSGRDPLPFAVYVSTRFLPDLFRFGARGIWSIVKRRLSRKAPASKKGLTYESQLEK